MIPARPALPPPEIVGLIVGALLALLAMAAIRPFCALCLAWGS